MPEKLTQRELDFIAFYNGNATETAIKAGYSPKTAAKRGCLLAKKLASYIQTRHASNPDTVKKIADREERQAFLTSIMRDENEKTENRLKACDLLAKSEGDYLNHVEVTGANGTPLTPPNLVVEFIEPAAIADDRQD